MNKKNTRKGFTIVELVIVIAVIAILATVLVPTFGNVIEKANKSAARQEAKNLHTNYIMAALDAGNETYVEDCWVKVDDYYVQIVDGGVVEDDEGIAKEITPTECYWLLTEDGNMTATEVTGCTATDCAKGGH